MAKCLVTTLKAAVNDNSLLRIGEMRIKISSMESPNEYSQSIKLGFTKSVDLEIIGEGYFTDATLSANNGKKMTCNVGDNIIHFSNGNYEIAVLDKYSLNSLTASKQDDKFYPNKVIDLKYLKYSYNLNRLFAGEGNLSGDISALSGLTSLTTLNVSNCNFSGDISALSGLTSLTYLYLQNNNLSGDISALSGLTSLYSLDVSYNNLSGDISALSGLTSLKVLDVANNNLSGDISALSGLTSLTYLKVTDNSNISGDVSSLSSLTLVTRAILGIENDYAVGGTKLICSNIATLKSMTSLKELYVKGINIQGDLSLLPAGLMFLSNKNVVSNCSWDNSRPSSSSIFAIEGSLTVNNIDGMLNDFSNCVVPSKPSGAYYSTIDVSGTRTSASDAAVSSLKSKGYTIKVNGVTI